MGVPFSVEEAGHRLLGKRNKDLLKAEVGITFGNPAKVLAVLIGKAIKDKSSQLIHPLAVLVLRVAFEEGKDDAGEAVEVVSFAFVLLLRQVHLPFLYAVLLEALLQVLDLELFLEEFAAGFCPFRIFLDYVPKLLVLEEGLPLGLLERVQGMISHLLLALSFDLTRTLNLLGSRVFLFLLLYHNFQHILSDQLIVVYHFALNERNPLVFGTRQILHHDFP